MGSLRILEIEAGGYYARDRAHACIVLKAIVRSDASDHAVLPLAYSQSIPGHKKAPPYGRGPLTHGPEVHRPQGDQNL